MKGLIIIIISLMLAMVVTAQINHLSFYREDIHFKIEDNLFYVDGTFFFMNTGTSNMVKVLRFPFPEDTLRFGKVLVFGIRDLTDYDEHIILEQNQFEVQFKIRMRAGQKKRYRIYYKQEFRGKMIEFPLLTTRKWGKAFNEVNFWLEMPSELELTYVSYKPDSTFVRDNKRFYWWQRKDFMPDKNLIFKF